AEVSADTGRRTQTRDYWRRVARQTVLKNQKLARTPLAEVTAGNLNRYLNELALKTPAQSKKARMLIRQVLQSAVLDGAVPHNVAHDLPKPKRRAKGSRHGQVRALTV